MKKKAVVARVERRGNYAQFWGVSKLENKTHHGHQLGMPPLAFPPTFDQNPWFCFSEMTRDNLANSVLSSKKNGMPWSVDLSNTTQQRIKKSKTSSKDWWMPGVYGTCKNLMMLLAPKTLWAMVNLRGSVGGK